MGGLDYVRRLFGLFVRLRFQRDRTPRDVRERAIGGEHVLDRAHAARNGVYTAHRTEDATEAVGTDRFGGADECDRSDPETGSECHPNPDN